MAYTSGTAAHYKDLMSILATFAAANGWAILTQATTEHVAGFRPHRQVSYTKLGESRGQPRLVAHRPLPSMMMATCSARRGAVAFG